MVKLAVAQKRMFKNVFVCRSCGAKIRAEPKKILEGKVKCRKCKKKAFRPLRKK